MNKGMDKLKTIKLHLNLLVGPQENRFFFKKKLFFLLFFKCANSKTVVISYLVQPKWLLTKILLLEGLVYREVHPFFHHISGRRGPTW